MRRYLVLLILISPIVSASDMDAFDRAVFGDKANGIQPMTHDEMKAYKAGLDGNHARTDQAFDDALDRAYQLSPEQIRTIKRKDDRVKEEKARPARSYKGVITSDAIDLSPGADITVIRLAKNYACTISFLDSTGQPWPISHYSPGKSSVFTVTNPERHTHILEISSLKDYAQSNMILTFVGMDTPVVIEIISGFYDEVDFKKELHIPLDGPNAIRKTSHLPSVSDETMLAFLDNVPPSDAQLKALSGSDRNTLVWEYQGNLYIRSKAWLHIPAPLMRQNSSDGTRVYKTRLAPSLSMSLEGRPVQILLKD